MASVPFEDFERLEVTVGEARIFLRRAGSGAPVLLLHGFPQTHRMWRAVAELLAEDFTVLCADLRGYGRSSCPASRPDHSSYAKRAMARDMAGVMEVLGFGRFAIAGHDRGGRVAYRLALDSPELVTRLAVLDVLATADMWERTEARQIIDFWPWSMLAQPWPLPERLISAVPEAVVESALREWGTPADIFDEEARAAYAAQLRNPMRVHAICEDYRAAATLDHRHDGDDRAAGRRILCPLLVLWSARGPLNSWYSDVGGPLGLWQAWAADVRGKALEGGHFFPEEMPEQTAAELRSFFRDAP